ncbi:hypothetical protein AB1Y20_021592 [Prymnesium parvum]|uniref:Uncharacterized protein n=1 Tax=Prymnesium parvum TaxID=97485 RepID=A0AB34JK91_PRYPA
MAARGGGAPPRRPSDPTVPPTSTNASLYVPPRPGSGRSKELPTVPEPKGGRKPLPVPPALPSLPSSSELGGLPPAAAEELSTEQMLQLQAQQKREAMVRVYHALGHDMMMRNPPLAHAFLLRSLALAPRDGALTVEVLSTLGSCCIQQDNSHDALRYLQRAVEGAAGVVSEPVHARLLLNVCAALNKLGKHEEALAQAEAAASLLQRPPPARPAADAEPRLGKGRKVLLVAAAYQSAACHEYLGNRAVALKCAERGLSLASDAGLAPDDELVQRLRATKKDLSKPGAEGKPVPPRQSRPAKDPLPAAEIDATAAVVAELVDAKSRHEVQSLLARQAAKEASAAGEEAARREGERRVEAESAAAEAEEKLQEALRAASEAKAEAREARLGVGAAVERALAEAAEEHRVAVEAISAHAEEQLKSAREQAEVQHRSSLATEAELATARLRLRSPPEIRRQHEQLLREMETAAVQAESALHALREQTAREALVAAGRAEQAHQSALGGLRREQAAREASLSSEVLSLERKLAREVQAREEVCVALEAAQQRCESLRGELAETVRVERERAATVHSQAEERRVQAAAAAEAQMRKLREEAAETERALREQLTAEKAQAVEELRASFVSAAEESARLVKEAAAERDAARQAAKEAESNLSVVATRNEAAAEAAHQAELEAMRAAHVAALEQMAAEQAARQQAVMEVEQRKLEHAQQAAAENLSAALSKESFARAEAVSALRGEHEAALAEQAIAHRKLLAEAREEAAKEAVARAAAEAEAKQAMDELLALRAESEAAATVAEERSALTNREVEAARAQAVAELRVQLEAAHREELAAAAAAYEVQLESARVDKEKAVVEARHAAVLEAEARGKAEQEARNLKEEVARVVAEHKEKMEAAARRIDAVREQAEAERKAAVTAATQSTASAAAAAAAERAREAAALAEASTAAALEKQRAEHEEALSALTARGDATLREAKKAFCIAAAEEVDQIKRERDATIAVVKAESEDLLRIAATGHAAAVEALRAAHAQEAAQAKASYGELRSRLLDLEEQHLQLQETLSAKEVALAAAIGDEAAVSAALATAKANVQIAIMAAVEAAREDATVRQPAETAAANAREEIRTLKMEAAQREAVWLAWSQTEKRPLPAHVLTPLISMATSKESPRSSVQGQAPSEAGAPADIRGSAHIITKPRNLTPSSSKGQQVYRKPSMQDVSQRTRELTRKK